MVPIVLGNEVWFFPSLERGMEKARDLIKLYPRTAHGRVIVAEEILSAKGRFDRPWLANKGGLWLVLTLYDETLPQTRNLLSILMGLALARTVKSLGIEEVYVKWINDLHFRGRKLAGVLMEKWGDWILAGLGLNVNNPLPPSLPAVSLKTLLQREVPLREVLSLLLHFLNLYYQKLEEYERKLLEEEPCENPLIEELKRYSDTLGRCVYYSYNLDHPESGVFGEAVNFTQEGGLLLKTTQGELLEVASGEIIYL